MAVSRIIDYTCPDCGKVRQISLKTFQNKSVFTGKCHYCAHQGINSTHGDTRGGVRGRLYYIWHNMKRRCLDPQNHSYPYYGGRGITVCERWLKYENFKADVGYPPEGMTLDRIDNDGPYSPENCRWATRTEQNNNTRSNRMVTFQDKTQTIAQWAREIGIRQSSLCVRLLRGWPLERALAPLERQRR